MSTDKGFQGWGPIHSSECMDRNDKLDAEFQICICLNGPQQGDEKLLRYLYTHKHFTPFEMAGLTIEVQAPIFVFREWHRHRTQSYNELSARYTELPDMFYVPDVVRLMNSKQSNKNKQGSEQFDQTNIEKILDTIETSYGESRMAYEELLRQGVAREIARLVIPVAQYSRMRASANLRNWLQFLNLRLPANAQFEIRQYASAVANLVKDNFPRTYQLFNEA